MVSKRSTRNTTKTQRQKCVDSLKQINPRADAKRCSRKKKVASFPRAKGWKIPEIVGYAVLHNLSKPQLTTVTKTALSGVIKEVQKHLDRRYIDLAHFTDPECDHNNIETSFILDKIAEGSIKPWTTKKKQLEEKLSEESDDCFQASELGPSANFPSYIISGNEESNQEIKSKENHTTEIHTDTTRSNTCQSPEGQFSYVDAAKLNLLMSTDEEQTDTKSTKNNTQTQDTTIENKSGQPVTREEDEGHHTDKAQSILKDTITDLVGKTHMHRLIYSDIIQVIIPSYMNKSPRL